MCRVQHHLALASILAIPQSTVSGSKQPEARGGQLASYLRTASFPPAEVVTQCLEHSRGHSNPTVPVACGITGSFHCYNSLESILGIIFFSRLNDDAGMLHSAVNCSSSFSRTAKASAKALMH